MRTLLLLVSMSLVAPLTANATTYYVAVAGLGGEPEYEQRFTGWASDLDKILKASPGGDTQAVILKGAEATKARLNAAAADIARKAKPEDQLVLLLIGHGTFDGSDYKFNVPGPDTAFPRVSNWWST
jgi:hypothetical protein